MIYPRGKIIQHTTKKQNRTFLIILGLKMFARI